VFSSRHAQRLRGAKYLLHRPRVDKPRMIKIGDMLVDANRVTAAKDLDENGTEDYIVASPHENDARGAIRLYLMSRNGRVLKSRCIVPGKWGFDAKALKPGDLFGSAVHVIHDVNGDGVPDIAVGAPGDVHNGQRQGAVYVLLMSRGGAVVAHSKISAGSDPVLREQHKIGQGFGSFIWSVRDINGDMNDELVVGSGPQSKTFTLVLLGTDGKAVGGIKFGPSVDRPNTQNDSSQHGTRTEKPLSSVNETKLTETRGQCIINDSNCPCVQEKMRFDKLCLAPVHSNGRGRAMCKTQPCEASFRCSCQGTQMCSIASMQQKTFVYDGDADRGLSFCHEKKVHSKTVQLISGSSD
jgi:FG-GAP repeat